MRSVCVTRSAAIKRVKKTNGGSNPEWNQNQREALDDMRKRNQAHKTRSKARLQCAGVLLAVCLLAVGLVGCASAKLDAEAESIVITDLSQLEGETFEGFDQLKTLDLRAVVVDSARVETIRSALPECAVLWNVPLGSAAFDSTSGTLALPQDCTAADLNNLRYFPALTRVDATACAVDAAFASAAAAFPGIAFSWNTTIGGVSVMSTDTTLDLTNQQSLSPEQVLPLLRGLPALERIDCTGTGWSAEQIALLTSSYPAIAFVSDVDVFGERVPATTQTLDLSGKSVDLAQLPAVLSQLPALTSVNLEGQAATFEQMDTLTAAFPNIAFSFSFELFSQQVTTATTELDLNGYALSAPEEIASKLKYLPNLTKCDLCDCGLSNEQMEQLMTQFPAVKFVWMIRIGAWEVRTDITAFSKGNRSRFPNDMGWLTDEGKTNFGDDDIQVLKYCTDLVYLDLGHGNRITDVSVIAQLKKLRVLIVSMNKIVDISPLAQLQELECLEIYQNPITDISTVTALPKLKYLNCSATYITDVTPLLGLKNLKMLWFITVKYVSKEQRQQLTEALPDCEICFHASSSGEGGWTGNPLYIEYQTAFGLPYNQ